jgi:putative iron-only hydrogenase system regulator
MKRVGVIGIVVTGDKKVSVEMQKLLNEFSDIIIGRLGVPRAEVSAIGLIVEGTVEQISALTGRLGKFSSLSVKSALTSFEIDEQKLTGKKCAE